MLAVSLCAQMLSLSPGCREDYLRVPVRVFKCAIRCLGMVGLDVDPLSWLCTVSLFSLRADPKFLSSLLLAESPRTQVLMQVLCTQLPDQNRSTLRLNGFKVTQLEWDSSSNSIPVGTGPYTV